MNQPDPKLLVDSCVFISAFNAASGHMEDSRRFLEELARRQQPILMPAHGWFEVWCSLRRIEKIDKTFDGPLFEGIMQFPIELIHIDKDFILKYGNIDIPYTRAGDHIFLVVAHVNGYELVTWDQGMTKVAKGLNVAVYSPSEYLGK